MLEKSGMSDRDKSKWMTVLVPGFVSSDHSCSDSEDEALVTQPLEWRSTKVEEFFYQLAEEGKSAQVKKNRRKRGFSPIICLLVLLLMESSLPGLLIQETDYIMYVRSRLCCHDQLQCYVIH